MVRALCSGGGSMDSGTAPRSLQQTCPKRPAAREREEARSFFDHRPFGNSTMSAIAFFHASPIFGLPASYLSRLDHGKGFRPAAADSGTRLNKQLVIKEHLWQRSGRGLAASYFLRTRVGLWAELPFCNITEDDDVSATALPDCGGNSSMMTRARAGRRVQGVRGGVKRHALQLQYQPQRCRNDARGGDRDA
jgi:hypothetical protein